MKKNWTNYLYLFTILFLIYLLCMSTFMVFMGRMEPFEKVRFLIAFQLPWDMPQLLNVRVLPDWAVHLSFRVYSMMFTTTVLGLLLGWIFRSRTWCAICPINTVSSIALKKLNKGQK